MLLCRDETFALKIVQTQHFIIMFMKNRVCSYCALPFLSALMSVFILVACEKPMVEADGESGESAGGDGKCVLSINASQLENFMFEEAGGGNRSIKPLGDVCARVSFVIFNGDEKVKTVNQKSTDKDFGKASVSLDKGTYTLVVIAHNGTGNPTFTSPEEIKFPDNKVTETFYYCGNVDVDGTQDYDITLKHAVAMFRLTMNDATPQGVKRMKFYYTGGSSTFDAVAGYGCVNSKQTEYRDVTADAYEGSSSYEVYTFPHSDGRTLKMDVSALSSDGTTVMYSKTFDDVSVVVNQITEYVGSFYGENPDGGRGFNVTVDDSWTKQSFAY